MCACTARPARRYCPCRALTAPAARGLQGAERIRLHCLLDGRDALCGERLRIEENLYIAYVSSALGLMYSKAAKAAMHEIPWNAKPTFSSASVISETLCADKIDYFFSFPLLISNWSYASG